MIVFPDTTSTKLIDIITGGGVGVLLTDTIYGIVAKADNEAAVQRVYDIKDRTDSKPPIVLIAAISQLYDPLPDGVDETIDGRWPGKNSIILPSPSAPDWLVRGSNGVAYRMPDNALLQRLIRETGPLIAPSANPQGQTPARSIGEAQGYFGDSVDFYVDGGVAFDTRPSNLYTMTVDGYFEQLR
jgi:tRNA threonylcarbamoyl adenosine modification protein (Sua5/YciO/YrdC/YwlC family)